jgi:hypothetical protein
LRSVYSFTDRCPVTACNSRAACCSATGCERVAGVAAVTHEACDRRVDAE